MVFLEASGCGPLPRATTQGHWIALMLAGLWATGASAGVTAFNRETVAPWTITGDEQSALADVAAALQVAAEDPLSFGYAEPGWAERPTALDLVLNGGWGPPAFDPAVSVNTDLESTWSTSSPTEPGSGPQIFRLYDLDPPQTGDRQVVPAPAAAFLASLGVALVGSLRRRM